MTKKDWQGILKWSCGIWVARNKGIREKEKTVAKRFAAEWPKEHDGWLWVGACAIEQGKLPGGHSAGGLAGNCAEYQDKARSFIPNPSYRLTRHETSDVTSGETYVSHKQAFVTPFHGQSTQVLIYLDATLAPCWTVCDLYLAEPNLRERSIIYAVKNGAVVAFMMPTLVC